MITWGDVIDIITWSFNMNQTDLAKRLSCDKSVISKVKSGKKSAFFTSSYLFAMVFDPASPDSPAHVWSDTSKACLRHLKEEIEDRFKEVREDMDDYWEEEDYKVFVFALLGRARPRPSSKVKPPHPDGNEKNTAASDIVSDKDCHENQKGPPLGETPSEQMSKLFEQAVANYNIATYICKLPDYFNGESFHAGDIFAFIDTIQTEVLGKYVNQQNETIFKKISDFNVALEVYSSFLGVIRLAISEEYGVMWKICGSYDEVFCLVDNNYSKAKAELEKEMSTEGNSSNKSSIDEAETNLNQLDFLRSILLAYKQICELYSEICTGKTLLVF